MNRLQLCQRLRLESGTANDNRLTTTIGLTGELDRLVTWIDEAYEDIQDKRIDWDFLRNDFSFNCVIGTSAYATTTVTNLANWKDDSFRCYLTTVNDEQWLCYRPWTEFRDTRLYGANRTVTGRPIDFTIKPDKSLVVWPIPDDTYTINGEYYKKAHVMTLDADEPLFSRHQMAIVWNALMRYAAYAQEPSAYAQGQKEYNRLIAKLERDRLRPVSAGGALA